MIARSYVDYSACRAPFVDLACSVALARFIALLVTRVVHLASFIVVISHSDFCVSLQRTSCSRIPTGASFGPERILA